MNINHYYARNYVFYHHDKVFYNVPLIDKALLFGHLTHRTINKDYVQFVISCGIFPEYTSGYSPLYVALSMILGGSSVNLGSLQ